MLKVIPDGASAAEPTVMAYVPSAPPKMAVFAVVHATLPVPLFHIKLVADKSQAPVPPVTVAPSPGAISHVKLAATTRGNGASKMDNAVIFARDCFINGEK